MNNPAIVLILGGVLGPVYGGFSYARETHEAKLGHIELSVKDKRILNVPVCAGVFLLAASAAAFAATATATVAAGSACSGHLDRHRDCSASWADLIDGIADG